MFLVAATRSSIANQFSTVIVNEVRFAAFTITIVVDNFLSKNESNSNGFSVFESPILSSKDHKKIILSLVSYKREDNTFEIYTSGKSVRPIYYHINKNSEFFCSTHISMLRKAGVIIEENTNALPEFFVYRYVMPPLTLYKNIYQLPSESSLFVELVCGAWTVKSVDRYVPPEGDSHTDSLTNIKEQVGNHLYQAVDPLNTYRDSIAMLNSGGLDSSVLFKICQKRLGINNTYSTEYPFEDPNRNIERQYALSAAKAFGTNHNHYQATTEDYLRGFLYSIGAAESPVVHLQSVLLYLLFKSGIPENISVILSAEGADTVFGTDIRTMIYKYKKWPRRVLTINPVPVLLRIILRSGRRGKEIQRLLTDISKVKIHGNEDSLESPESIIWSLDEYGDKEWVGQYFHVTNSEIIGNRLNNIKPYLKRSIYDILVIIELFGGYPATTSTWGKLGESQRKILYCPFHRVELVDYVCSLPYNIKLKEPKYVLRSVARQQQIPEFIINRPKIGFGINMRTWAEKGSIFEPLVPLASRVFDEKQIRAMQAADPRKAMTFWNILNYSIWKRLCIDNEPVEVLLEQLSSHMHS
jgi:asparagine synthase (glutamine-hydrolysing)